MLGPHNEGDSGHSDKTGGKGLPVEPSPDLAAKQAYEAARAELRDANGNPTPHYQAYLKYQNEYDNKVKARKEAYDAALTDPMKLQNWPIDGVSYSNDVDEARDRWVSLGFKNEIDKALATLAAQGTAPLDSSGGRQSSEC